MNNSTPLRSLARVLAWKPPSAITKKLKGLDDQHRIGLERLNELSVQSVTRLYLESVARSEAALRSATSTTDLHQVGTHTKSQILVQLANQRQGLKAALRVLTDEATDLAGPLFDEFITLASTHVDQLRDAEAAVAKSYGCDHVDSSTVGQLTASLTELGSARRHRGGYVSPSALVQPLFDL